MARRDDNEMGAQAGLGSSPNGAATLDAPKAPRKKRGPRVYGPNDLVGVMIRVPEGLRKQIEGTANEQSVSVPQIVVRMIADAYEYTLPSAAKRTRAKYASDAERKAATKAAADKKRATIQALLKAVEDGKIDVDVDALVAEMQANAKAEADAKAAASASASEGSGAMPEPAMAGAAS